MTLVSVFTPSHNFQHLDRAYHSLLNQTHKEWEWIVLVNGAAIDPEPVLIAKHAEEWQRFKESLSPEDYAVKVNLMAQQREAFVAHHIEVLDLLEADPRVKMHRSDSPAIVGRLKAEACDLAKGEVLVELDHDDELHPNCLQRILDVYTDRPGGFYFSDWCEKNQDGTFRMYNHVYGWEVYQSVWEGQEKPLVAHKAREVDARSLYQIFYAPNHVRAWSREAYEKTGGYDRTLDICDDHELLIRTYLVGVQMIRIPECLYLQHVNPDQTQTIRNADIQVKQAELGALHLERLCLEWSKRKGLKNYDLGAAHSPAAGYMSVDLYNADLCIDVTKGLPFRDNAVGVIRAHDFLEHLPPAAVIPFMNECYRVLAPGGWMLTNTPSTDGRGAYQDPTHVSFWNSNSFWYYTNNDQRRYVPAIKAKFQLTRIHNYYPSDWHRDHLITYVAADLWAMKGQPTCGIDLTIDKPQ